MCGFDSGYWEQRDEPGQVTRFTVKGSLGRGLEYGHMPHRGSGHALMHYLSDDLSLKRHFARNCQVQESASLKRVALKRKFILKGKTLKE